MTTSQDVSWQLDGIDVDATAERPDGTGPFPAVVLVAGSGPTDRNWCSPMLPGTNGSAVLFAEALAAAGIASIRYDKRASGPHALDNARAMAGQMSMKSHLDELAAAVDALVGLDFVDASRIVGLGNSEGTLHVLHYALGKPRHPFVGLVLAAPPGRPIQTVLLAQLRAQAAQVPDGDALMVKVEEAAARYAAGQPMAPDDSIPTPVRNVLLAFDVSENLPFARELWVESATDLLAKDELPTLVLIGGKDIQIDQHADGDPLQAVAAGKPNIEFAFPPNANHVFKEETRTVPEIAASGAVEYNDDGKRLDPEALETILSWLKKTFA